MRVTQQNPRWSEEEFNIVRSMAAANIGRRYLDLRLSGFGTVGETLAKHFEPEHLADRILTGRCTIIEARDYKGHDLLMTYMKAFVLSGYTAIVNPVEEYFPSNSFYAPEEHGPFDSEKDVIGLAQFWSHSPGENPLTPKEKRMVENHILNRLDDNVPMVFAGVGKFSKTGWWSETLRQRILENGEVYEL